MIRHALTVIVAGVLAVPFTIAVAVASLPVLRKIEQLWSMELVGHSGPADWLLVVIWLVISAVIAATISSLRTRKGRSE